MSLYERITAGLEPLGGELFIDQFIQARRAALAGRRAALKRLEKPARPEDRPEAAASREEPPAPRADKELREEVQDFMRRGEVEEADNAEIQEFLRERRGFDPGSLE